MGGGKYRIKAAKRKIDKKERLFYKFIDQPEKKKEIENVNRMLPADVPVFLSQLKMRLAECL